MCCMLVTGNATRAYDVNTKLGITGLGVKVGVIDTGEAFHACACTYHSSNACGHTDGVLQVAIFHLCMASHKELWHSTEFDAVLKAALSAAGIDYMHPDLGNGFGPGHRVIAGYDFVGDDGATVPGSIFV